MRRYFFLFDELNSVFAPLTITNKKLFEVSFTIVDFFRDNFSYSYNSEAHGWVWIDTAQIDTFYSAWLEFTLTEKLGMLTGKIQSFGTTNTIVGDILFVLDTRRNPLTSVFFLKILAFFVKVNLDFQ